MNPHAAGASATKPSGSHPGKQQRVVEPQVKAKIAESKKAMQAKKAETAKKSKENKKTVKGL